MRRGSVLIALTLALASVGCDSGTAVEPGPRGAPVVLAVDPERGEPGQVILISGANFGSDPATVEVRVGEDPAEILSFASGQVAAIIPPDAQPGVTVVRLLLRGLLSGEHPLTVLSPGPPFASVSVGSGFRCGVHRQGGAACWGTGSRGQLGIGSAPNHAPTPRRVEGGIGFVAVTAGIFHACGLTGAGTAHCWGQNRAGQLGDGTTSLTGSPSPLSVAGGLAFSAVSAGGFHTCGLALDGSAHCWGDNAAGQLGNGGRTGSPVPVAVAGGLRFTAISAGGFHSCGLAPDRRAWCWGENTHGELGNGATDDSPAPVAVGGGLTFDAISAGRMPPVGLTWIGEHTCGLTDAGEAWCWGFNADGQLGDGFQRAETHLPVPVASGAQFRSISAGSFYTCGVTPAGEALCWGANDSGQLGHDTSSRSLAVPTRVAGSLRFESVSAGGASKTVIAAPRPHTCGVTVGGFVYCWGRGFAAKPVNGTVAGLGSSEDDLEEP